MASSSPPTNPFVPTGMIEDTRLFVGRQEELRAIASRMTGAQPISINIVGDKRIGKSSLLNYFCLTWKERVETPERYVVIYLPLRKVACQTETGFYQAVAEALPSPIKSRPFNLANFLQPRAWNRETFSEAIRQWKQKRVLPVLCLDDFESLLDYPQQFNDGFYDTLRSLMEENALMLVITSLKSLTTHGSENRFVSSFFNIAHCFKLAELNTDEAMQLTRLPTRSPYGAALSPQEQNYAQEWGHRHPYKLQLAGYFLWEARQQGKSILWAKKKFEQQIAASKPSRQGRGWKLWANRIFVVAPRRLGNGAKLIGTTFSDISAWIIGIIFLVMLVRVVAGELDWNQIWDYVREKLGIK